MFIANCLLLFRQSEVEGELSWSQVVNSVWSPVWSSPHLLAPKLRSQAVQAFPRYLVRSTNNCSECDATHDWMGGHWVNTPEFCLILFRQILRYLLDFLAFEYLFRYGPYYGLILINMCINRNQISAPKPIDPFVTTCYLVCGTFSLHLCSFTRKFGFSYLPWPKYHDLLVVVLESRRGWPVKLNSRLLQMLKVVLILWELHFYHTTVFLCKDLHFHFCTLEQDKLHNIPSVFELGTNM